MIVRYGRAPALSLAAAAVILLPLQTARAMQSGALEIVREGDTELSCHELSAEAAEMQAIVNNTQDIRNSSEMQERGISVAGAAAGLLVGTVTGGIGIAAAGLLAKHASESRGDQAENLQDIAFQRRSFMHGIYKAKACQGPIEHTLLMPEKPGNPLARLNAVEPAAGDERPAIRPAGGAISENPAETNTETNTGTDAETDAPSAADMAEREVIPSSPPAARPEKSRFND